MILAEREASPTELSRLLFEPLGKIAYHVRVLLRAGAIELVKEEPRRGSMEHWFRACERPVLTDAETAARTPKERLEYADYISERAHADIAVALESGTLGERHDHAILRMPMQLDERGWKEMNAAYVDLYGRMLGAQAASAERMANSDQGAGSIRVSAFAAFFEMPTTT